MSDGFEFVNFNSKLMVLFLIFEQISLFNQNFLYVALVEIQYTKRELRSSHFMNDGAVSSH